MSLSISDVNAIIATTLPPKSVSEVAPESDISAPAEAQPSNVITNAAVQNPAVIATQAAAARFGLGL